MNPFLPGLTSPPPADAPLVWRFGSEEPFVVAAGESVGGVRVVIRTLDGRIVFAANSIENSTISTISENLENFLIQIPLPPGLYLIHAATAHQSNTRALEVLGPGWTAICPPATLQEMPFEQDDPFPESPPVTFFPA